jgi:riboflavin kinase / FMN adenylyltransferase
MKKRLPNSILNTLPYTASVRGIVRHGNKRGRTLGYPTANVLLHRKLRSGIYVSIANIDGEWRQSLTYIGSSETFGAGPRKIETHVLDYSGNLYDTWLTVRLLSFIHPSIKFTTVPALIAQMKKDEVAARGFFR